MFYFLAYLFFSLSHLEMCLYISAFSLNILLHPTQSVQQSVVKNEGNPVPTKKWFFQKHWFTTQGEFWVTLSLILAGFSCLRLGTDRPTKCLKIYFLYGFSRVFANYTFWTTCHKLYNVSNCLILKFFMFTTPSDVTVR